MPGKTYTYSNLYNKNHTNEKYFMIASIWCILYKPSTDILVNSEIIHTNMCAQLNSNIIFIRILLKF